LEGWVNVLAEKACVFCGRAGVKFSREHAFPNWISKVLALSGVDAVLLPSDGRGRQWTARQLDQQVKVVCGDCNNGWMSHELEVPAIPLLTPMILGEGQHARLGRERQQLLAAWSLKTAMMVEHIFPDMLVLPALEYAYLYRHKIPSPGTVVLLSAHKPRVGERGVLVATSKNASMLGVVRQTSGDPLPDVPEPYRAGLVMFAVQNLVATVFSHNLPAQLDIDVHPPRPGLRFEDYFQQVWPVVHDRLRWPPRDLDEVGGLEKTFEAWASAT
jgi:hypothetical protein